MRFLSCSEIFGCSQYFPKISIFASSDTTSFLRQWSAPSSTSQAAPLLVCIYNTIHKLEELVTVICVHPVMDVCECKTSTNIGLSEQRGTLKNKKSGKKKENEAFQTYCTLRHTTSMLVFLRVGLFLFSLPYLPQSLKMKIYNKKKNTLSNCSIPQSVMSTSNICWTAGLKFSETEALPNWLQFS